MMNADITSVGSKSKTFSGGKIKTPSVSNRVLRLPAVINKIGIARSTIYDWMDPKSPRYDPTFPKQVRLGLKSVGWLEADLDAWILGCISAGE